MSEAHESLGTALPTLMAKIRDESIPAYKSIGPAGGFALWEMRNDLDRATKALAEGDVGEMVLVYASLKEYKL